MEGKFITLEGTEGVGKSTNLDFIKNSIEARGIEVIVTREPGGTPLAEEIRATLLAKRDEHFDPTAELLMVFAARAQHLRQKILPNIAEGKWVISDRFTDATFAYQGAGRGLPMDTIRTLEKMVQGNYQPDATFYLDIDVGLGLARAKKRAALDRFEEEQLAFFERVREGYLQRVKEDPRRFYLINAGQSLSDVQAQIAEKVDQLFTAVT